MRGRWGIAALAMMVVMVVAEPARAESKPLIYTVVAVEVIAGVSAGLGGLFLGLASIASSDADDAGAALANRGLAVPCQADPVACADIDDDLERHDDMTTGAIAAFATAGWFALLGVGFLIKGAADGDLATRVEVGPTVVQGGGGAQVAVRF